MVSKAQKARLGFFLFFSTLTLLIMLVLVAGNSLMEKLDYYKIVYDDVSVNGLQVGGQVKYHGIRVGRIEDISISQDDISKVVVSISMKEGTPVKKDVFATLVPVGITGLKQIELTGGTNASQKLPTNSYITSGLSTFDNITGKAEIIAEKIELAMNNIIELTGSVNQKKFTSILNNVDQLIIENRNNINNTFSNIDSLSQYFTELTVSTTSLIKKLDNLIGSEQLDRIVNNSADFSDQINQINIKQLSDDLQKVTINLNNTIENIDWTVRQSKGNLIDSIELMKETMEYLNEFSRLISEDPTQLLRSKKNK